MPDTTLPEPSVTILSKGRTTASGSSEKTDIVRKLHFVLQGKGGVGKTVAALLLAQCIEEKGEPVICVDTYSPKDC
jgi:Mrp family chromosome partitioning ATPase